MRGSDRLVALEAVRGIAALVVLVHHALLGFAPRLHGLLYQDQPYALAGTPLFALVNGSAAVILFFVLSGFVLTFRIMEEGRAARVPVAAFKRWPRLMLPVLAVNLASGALMAAGLYANLPAAQVTGSRWLGWFYAWPSEGFHELVKAGWEGAFGMFSFGANFYNANLWTLYYEIWGSLVALGCALIHVYRPGDRAFAWVMAALWAVATAWTHYMAPFVAGAALAAYYVANRGADWRARSLLWLAPAAFLLGYHEGLVSGGPEGWYAFLGPLAQPGPLRLRVLLHTLAAAAVILLALKSAPLRRLLSGRAGALLGRLSFPVYLTQMLVIASVSSWFFLLVDGLAHIPRVGLTLAVTVAVTVLVSVPVMWLDGWWLRTLGEVSARLAARLSARRGGDVRSPPAARDAPPIAG